MSKLKIAILGFGRSGSTLHADSIAASQQFDVVAVCDHVNIFYLNGITLLGIKGLHPDHLSGSYLVLFSSGHNDCIHSKNLLRLLRLHMFFKSS